MIKINIFVRRTRTQEKFTTSADFILGADGAYSLIRRLMSKTPRFNFTQTYIDHGYVELSYPGIRDGKVIINVMLATDLRRQKCAFSDTHA